MAANLPKAARTWVRCRGFIDVERLKTCRPDLAADCFARCADSTAASKGLIVVMVAVGVVIME